MTYTLKPVKSEVEMLQDVLAFAQKNHLKFEEKDKSYIIMIYDSFQINLRKNSSDFHVFWEIFVEEDYKKAIDFYSKNFNENPKTILDIGANIGCASLYFRNFFPESQIISIEAEEENYLNLATNIQVNKTSKIEILHNAFWVNNEDISIEKSFRDGRDWAFSARENDNISQSKVKGITLENIIEKYNLSQIDILKIDIEGGEKWIFEDKTTLDLIQKQVNFLVMEVHQEVVSLDTIKSILENINFKVVTEGSLIFAYS